MCWVDGVGLVIANGHWLGGVLGKWHWPDYRPMGTGWMVCWVDSIGPVLDQWVVCWVDSVGLVIDQWALVG